MTFTPLPPDSKIPRVAGSDALRERIADVLLGDILEVEVRDPGPGFQCRTTYNVAVRRKGQRVPRWYYISGVYEGVEKQLSLASLLCAAYGDSFEAQSVKRWLMPAIRRRFPGFEEKYDAQLALLAGRAA